MLLALSLMPASWSAWVASVGDMARFIIAPIQQPVYALARWLAPGRGTKPDDQALAEIRAERDRFQALFLREQDRTSELERRVQELQRGLAFNEVPVRQVSTTVVGHTSEGATGGIVVRAGSGQGVEVNNVVTAGGVQIVGRIARVGIRQSEVRPITHPATQRVRGRIMLSPETRGPLCFLNPMRSGDALQGRVEYRQGDPPVERGMLVRLDDPAWPASAGMLVLGVIESIQSETAGAQIVLVKPTLDLLRLSEVIVRTNPEPAELPAEALKSSTQPSTQPKEPAR